MHKTSGRYLRWILWLAFLGVALFTLTPRYAHVQVLAAQVDELEMERDRLLKLQTELELKQEEVQTLEYVERLAREKLGMVKRGERVMLEFRQ
jgi:cell division protein FtsB